MKLPLNSSTHQVNSQFPVRLCRIFFWQYFQESGGAALHKQCICSPYIQISQLLKNDKKSCKSEGKRQSVAKKIHESRITIEFIPWQRSHCFALQNIWGGEKQWEKRWDKCLWFMRHLNLLVPHHHRARPSKNGPNDCRWQIGREVFMDRPGTNGSHTASSAKGGRRTGTSISKSSLKRNRRALDICQGSCSVCAATRVKLHLQQLTPLTSLLHKRGRLYKFLNSNCFLKTLSHQSLHSILPFSSWALATGSHLSVSSTPEAEGA